MEGIQLFFVTVQTADCIFVETKWK